MKSFVIKVIKLAAALAPVALLLGHAFDAAGVASAAPSGCTQGTPTVRVQNSWAWSAWGSWGLPGQQLAYLIDVGNTDVGCSSSSFVVTVSAPSGFSVSAPTSTVTLRSSAMGSLRTNVTSPGGIADGNYPITVTVTRAGASGPASSFTSSYKVYSSDSTAPTLYWPNPGAGTTISGRSYNVMVSSSDDHMVKKIELFIDNPTPPPTPPPSRPPTATGSGTPASSPTRGPCAASAGSTRRRSRRTTGRGTSAS